MFRAILTQDPTKTAIGLRWTVEREDFDGSTQPFAYFEAEADARLVAETLNEQASVVAAIVEPEDDSFEFVSLGEVS